MAPRKTTSGSRRDEIIAVATELFAAQGYNGTPIRQIARRCDITEAAIYRHFDNKEHLYSEVARSKAADHDIAGRLQQCPTDGPLVDSLRWLAHFILDLGSEDPQIIQLMSSCCRENDEAAATLFREVRLPLIEFLEKELARRIALGGVKPVDPFITARCFVGMVMDCAMCVGVWAKLNARSLRQRDVVDNNVPIFAGGLVTGA